MNNPKAKTIVFFEHNPYMSVELLDLLHNYRIACFNDDETYRVLRQKWDIVSYLNTEFIEEPESDQVAELLLGHREFLLRATPEPASVSALFFYMNARMDELRKRAGLELALPDFQLQEKMGSKIYLAEICSLLELPQNISLSFPKLPDDLSSLFDQCKKALGVPFIIQGEQGEGGWDTSLVATLDELQESMKRIEGGMRASRYLTSNLPLSVHVCIEEDAISIQGPWLQLMGLEELSLGAFRFGGNDTNQSLLNTTMKEEARDMSHKIAQFARDAGYRGILGIDYLWDKTDNLLYPQEINSRLVGLTRLLTGIQKDQGLVPDLLKHILAFTPIVPTEKVDQLREGELDLSGRNYSQIIVRNNEPSRAKIANRLHPGIYKLVGNEFQKTNDSLFVDDMAEDEILITYAAHKGCVLTTGEVVVRMILKQSVLQNEYYALTAGAADLVSKIRLFMLTQE